MTEPRRCLCNLVGLFDFVLYFRPRFARRPRGSGFTLIEVLIVVAILSILMGVLLPSIQVGQQRATKSMAASTIATLNGALARFYSDHRFYPGTQVEDSDVKNSFPHLFEALLGERAPRGRGGRNAPYLDIALKDIAVWDEEDQEFRRASLEERFDAEVPKFVLDPWGSPYWYRETRSRSPDSCLIRNRGSADIWSVGPDRENQTLAGVEDSDDLGNW